MICDPNFYCWHCGKVIHTHHFAIYHEKCERDLDAIKKGYKDYEDYYNTIKDGRENKRLGVREQSRLSSLSLDSAGL